MLNKYELSQQLKGNVMTVVFTKADGTQRTMNCTLLPEYMPVPEPVGDQQFLIEDSGLAKTRSENPDVISVWDIDANGWRSFRLDSVISTQQNASNIY